MKRNRDKSAKIAIIGAGAGGMTAAWQLKQNGYHNVIVFEKDNRVGGKCETFQHEGRPFDMAAHEMLAGYRNVMDIAKALKVPWTGKQNILVYNPKKKTYLEMLEATIGEGYTKCQVAWAVARYTKMLLCDYREFCHPGNGMANTPKDLQQSLRSWITANKLEPLQETILFVMKVQGFGGLDDISAAYFVKFQGLGNWLSNVAHVAGLIQCWPRVFDDGFQSLWDKVANEVDIRLGANITKIVRQDKNGPAVELTFANGTTEHFDQLILACPLDLTTLDATLGLQLGNEEQRLLAKVNYVRFVTTACEVSGIPHGVVGTIPRRSKVGYMDYTGYIKTYDDVDLAVFFSLLPKERDADDHRSDDEIVYSNIKELVSELPRYESNPKPQLGNVIKQKTWNYFPHVDFAEAKAGFYDKFEALQGSNKTFYCTSLLSFETVGNVCAYATGLVNEHFPK